jgi:hypothetical protein
MQKERKENTPRKTRRTKLWMVPGPTKINNE